MFSTFAAIVARSFQRIAGSSCVLVADVTGDALYEAYLAAFPEGTNPIFKARTEHDCACCRQFIKRVGAAVSVKDGVVSTIWQDAAVHAPAPYAEVARALHELVANAGIRNLFRVGKSEARFGAEHTFSLDAGAKAIVWDHFYTGAIPSNLRSATPDADRGNFRTDVQVFTRGLTELSHDAVGSVLDLINTNALYRGEEHLRAVEGFKALQRSYMQADESARLLFAWEHASGPGARFRNTVIGTLVQDLSEDKDLEYAVKAFETKVAPQNYKRTTALITPGMVKQAMATIEELGLDSALERRYAVLSDVSVNDVKWVDGAVKPLMKGGIGDVLLQHATATRSSSKPEAAEDISIEDFMKLLPQVKGMEVLFQGSQAGNLMALTAPVNPEPKQLFRWSNDFAWSYGGNVADSIKERVKKAGGNVTGVLRVSLSWFNYDDLDLHIMEPKPTRSVGQVAEIYFRNKRGHTGGTLDVDMNAGAGTSREAVENVIWPNKMPDGEYKVVVHNYQFRESSDPGFTVEIENAGKLFHFSYNKGVRNDAAITVCTVHMKDGIIDRIEPGDAGITSTAISQEKWGLKTEQWVKVSAVMLSPNYWGDNHVGNKHTFFVLDGARSDEDTRGFYNEFLHPRLEPHRKVFEVIGDKTKCRPTDGQLAGLGFSSTKKESFTVRVQMGRKKRVFQVQFGLAAQTTSAIVSEGASL